ncbi:MAG: sulfotransferase [Candidatus Brocadia sp.]|nr:sulfotransferase [Candidatus Brocadia sp.]
MKRSIRLPNFIVVGAPKSGTTSLFYYLKQHPDIYLPVRKELHYFSYEYLKENTKGPGDKDVLSSLCANRREYESHYIEVKNERMIGDISPSYLYYCNVSGRILSELGKIKIVMVLRNPVEKAYTQYMHLIRDNRETLLFYDALMEEQKRMLAGWSDIWRYAESSLYAERVNKYISIFGPDNVKFILFDDFVIAPDEVMRSLFKFLNVDADVHCDTSKTYNRTGTPKFKMVSDFFAKPNPVKTIVKKIIPEKLRIPTRLALLDWNTGKKNSMDRKSREYLIKYFSDDIVDLSKILGNKLWWLNG